MNYAHIDGEHGSGTGVAYEIQILKSCAAVAALKDDWQQLTECSATPNVFMTYDWYQAWIGRLLAEGSQGRLEPYVLLLKQRGTTVGIAPFVRRTATRLGVHICKIEFLTHHSDYNELVVGRETAALSLAVMNHFAHNPREWDLIDLMEMRDCGSRIDEAKAAAARAGLSVRTMIQGEGCPWMPIDAPWSELRQTDRLQFAHRAALGFEKKSNEGFRVRIVDQPHLERSLLERLIAVEAQKKVDGLPSPPFIARYRSVFQTLLDTLGPRNSIAVVLAERNDELVSWLFLFRCGNKFWDYLTAFDRRFAALSPGTAVVCAALDYGFAHGCGEFDFLRGADAYKLRWTDKLHQNRRMLLWSTRWKSRLAAWALLRQHPLSEIEDELSKQPVLTIGENASQNRRETTLPDETPPELAANLAYYKSAAAVATYSFYSFLREEECLFPKYFKAGESVLDLGCGVGRTSLLMHELGMRVRGIDRSEVFIETARRRFPYLDLRIGSFDRLEEPDASYDHVLIALNSIDCAYPEAQRRQALRECARVLKPGGTLLYSSHNLKSLHWFSPYYGRRLRWKFRNFIHAFKKKHYILEDAQCLFYSVPSYVVKQTEAQGLKLVEIRGFNRFRSTRIDHYFSPYLHYVFIKPQEALHA